MATTRAPEPEPGEGFELEPQSLPIGRITELYGDHRISDWMLRRLDALRSWTAAGRPEV